jgi:prepilin peptidase CpaA
MNWQIVMTVAVGIAASVEDLIRRRVSNWIPMVALLAGLIIHFIERGWPGVWSAFLGALSGFAVFLVFYALGGMGGGDVKLMAGFGALLGGASRLFEAAIWTGGIGAVIAVGVLGYRFLRSRLTASGADGGSRFIPYAPAITLGVWLELVAKS